MYSRSFGYAVVNENNLASASIVCCREKHSLRIYVANSVGLEVGNYNNLTSNKLFGRVFLFDRGHNHTLADAVEKCVDENTYQSLKLNCEQVGKEIMGVSEYAQIIVEKYTDLKNEG